MKLTYDEYLKKAEKTQREVVEEKMNVKDNLLYVADQLTHLREILEVCLMKSRNPFEYIHHPEEVTGFMNLSDAEAEQLYELWDLLVSVSNDYTYLMNKVRKFESELAKIVDESIELKVDKFS